jgi:uncharacterized protein YbjT (DUF2867 family)
MQAVIAGSTGEVGQFLLHYVLDDAAFTSVAALVRRPSTIQHKKLTNTIIDFNQLSALDKQTFDVLFICLGTTIKKAGSQEAFRKVDYDYVVNLTQWAKNCGAKQVHIVSAMGADSKSRIFYSRVKGEMQNAVKEIGIPSTYIYQPSLLDSEREEQRLGERLGILIFRALRFLFVGPLKKYASIKVQDVAKGMVKRAKSAKSGYHIIPSDKI